MAYRLFLRAPKSVPIHLLRAKPTTNPLNTTTIPLLHKLVDESIIAPRKVAEEAILIDGSNVFGGINGWRLGGWKMGEPRLEMRRKESEEFEDDEDEDFDEDEIDGEEFDDFVDDGEDDDDDDDDEEEEFDERWKRK